MALNQRCANSQCPKHTEPRGGEFIYSREKREWFCKDCFYIPTVFNEGKNLWEFTTTHFNGEAIHVKSLSHLRELERQYGCSNHAANHMESQWNDPPKVKPWQGSKQYREIANLVERHGN